MASRPVRQSIQGQPFNEVLNELHAHTFSGVPGESDPFTLSEIEREFIAYALAIYYQCDHCQVYHGRVVDRLRKQAGAVDWDWRAEFVRIVLYLRTCRKHISELEWQGWVEAWQSYSTRLHVRHPGLADAVGYAVGIARADKDLMDLSFKVIADRYSEPEQLLGVIRDIDRLVVFMKAATSKNRTDPIVRDQLAGMGIQV